MTAAGMSVRASARRRELPFGAGLAVAGRYGGLLFFAALVLLPLYYVVYLALSKPGKEFTFPPHVLPHPTQVSNLWDSFYGTVEYPGNLFHYYGNSVMYAGLATLGCLITQSIVGYAFARLRFPGRNFLFGLTVAMLMMPFVVTLIPRFLLFRNLHLTNSLWPLIIPWWFGGSPYGIFLMRQFFMSIPKELDEAAKIDGLGHWRILWKILIPQAVPVLVALGILEASYFWNDLLGPLIYTETDSKMPITLGIFAHARTPYSFNYSLFFSIIVMMVLPIALIFLAFQGKFRRGFLFSGLGGR
jgi:multiple sugar transport system permease protein